MSQFNLPPGARNVGIFGGLILMAVLVNLAPAGKRSSG